MRLAANRREPSVEERTVTDSNGRTYQGWVCVEHRPYLHEWPPRSGHKVSLDVRLPWKLR